jgi:hypothetical protein
MYVHFKEKNKVNKKHNENKDHGDRELAKKARTQK